MLVIHQRQQIVDETDQNNRDDDADEMEDVPRMNGGPSKEAISKFTDYGACGHPWSAWTTLMNPAEIPYINDEHADAATKNARLQLVFRLLEFTILAEGMLRVSRMNLDFFS